MTTLVSIIMPAFNSGKHISETLHSIQRQTFTDWECIVIDDGSSDNTADIVTAIAKTDTRLRLIRRPHFSAKGASSCRNIGLTIATGEFIQFFDSDDLMLPTHLEEKVEIIGKAGADVVVCKLREVFVNSGATRVNSIGLANGVSDLVAGVSNWYVCGPMWRTSVIKGIWFPEDISNLDDLVFNLRCLRKMNAIVYLNEPLIEYIRHDAGITGAYSGANVKEIDSTILARMTIGKELKTGSCFSPAVSRALIRSCAHLGYLVAIKRNQRTMKLFIRLILASTMPQTLTLAVKTLGTFLFWAVSGRGYALLRFLKA